MAEVLHVHKEELGEKGQKIYDEILRPLLEPEHRGEIVAIEVESGDYFLGESVLEAVKKGREKYPNTVFYAVRIGYPVVYSGVHA